MKDEVGRVLGNVELVGDIWVDSRFRYAMVVSFLAGRKSVDVFYG